MKILKNKDLKFFLIMSLVTYVIYNLMTYDNNWLNSTTILQSVLSSFIAAIGFHYLR